MSISSILAYGAGAGIVSVMVGTLILFIQVYWLNYGSPEGQQRVGNTLSWLILIGRATLTLGIAMVVAYVLETH